MKKQVLLWMSGAGIALLCCFLFTACKRRPAAAEAMDQGYFFLAGIQQPDGAICDTVNPLFDIWETVEAATAIWACTHDSSDAVLQKALQFLQAQENPAGLLCHNRKCKAQYCLETTAEYCILLAEIYGPQAIQARMDTVRKLQKPSGEWAIGNPDVLQQQTFPSVTGFVLAALQAAELAPLHRDSAVAWLIAQQDTAGSWGAVWEYYGSPAYAIWANVRALSAERSPAAQAAVERAFAYLSAHRLEESYWDATVAGPKHISAALQTALVVAALGHGNLESSDLSIGSSVHYLVQAQAKDGHWDGGDFPIANARYQKHEYVFATARAMVAMRSYLGDDYAD
jgi:Squalene-hopene cyclase C-terminal domain